MWRKSITCMEWKFRMGILWRANGSQSPDISRRPRDTTVDPNDAATPRAMHCSSESDRASITRSRIPIVSTFTIALTCWSFPVRVCTYSRAPTMPRSSSPKATIVRVDVRRSVAKYSASAARMTMPLQLSATPDPGATLSWWAPTIIRGRESPR